MKCKWKAKDNRLEFALFSLPILVLLIYGIYLCCLELNKSPIYEGTDTTKIIIFPIAGAIMMYSSLIYKRLKRLEVTK
jgi:hypothetical protein